MKSKANALIAVIAAVISSPVAAADESPTERYEIDRTCAAVSAVAIERNDLPATITTADAKPIQALYREKTRASGQRAGLDAAAISRDIAAVHQSIIANLASTDPKRAGTERSDTAKMMEKCTALVGFEIEKGAVGRQ